MNISFVKLIADHKGYIKGGSIVAPSASEMINLVSFAIKTKASSEKVLQALLEAGILGGYSLSSADYGLENAILIAVTEKRTKEEIDKLVSVIGGVR